MSFLHPGHHHYTELNYKLQSCTPLNNLFGQTNEYRGLYWIWVNPSWQLFNISEKEQAIIKYIFHLLSENDGKA